MRILLIEDDPVVTQSIELMLKGNDIEVQSVSAGEDGIRTGKLDASGG